MCLTAAAQRCCCCAAGGAAGGFAGGLAGDVDGCCSLTGVAPSAGFIATGDTPSGGIVTAASTLFRSSTTAGVRSNSVVGPEDLGAVQHQVDAAADRHLLRHHFDRPVDLRHHILAGLLDDAVALAEHAARLGDPVLQFLFTRTDLLRRELGAVVGQGLTQITQRNLLLLRVLIQLLAPRDELLVRLLEGAGGPHHVRHRQHADNGGRRGRAFRERGHLGRWRELDLNLRAALRHQARHLPAPGRRPGPQAAPWASDVEQPGGRGAAARGWFGTNHCWLCCAEACADESR